MREIPVEYNTGDGENQGGAMVLMEKPEEKPAYVTRKAPFWVYDCLEKEKMDAFVQRMGEAAVYMCLQAKAGLKPGNHTVYITAQTIEGEYRCKITVRVYDVSIPEHTFFCDKLVFRR